MPEEKVSQQECKCPSGAKYHVYGCALDGEPLAAADAEPRHYHKAMYDELSDVLLDDCAVCGESWRNTDVHISQPDSPPVPQEAAPLTPYGEALLQRIEDYRSGYSCGYNDGKNGNRMRDKDAAQLFFGKEAGGIPDILLDDPPTTAPDVATRVARQFEKMLADTDTVLLDDEDVVKLASLIREAGSERERELTNALRHVLAELDLDPITRCPECAEASRLLGGESK